MKTLLITTVFLFLNALCFSQQQLTNAADEPGQAVVQINSSDAQVNPPLPASDQNVVNGNKSYVGTKAIKATVSSTNSSGELNSQKARIGEKAHEAHTSEIGRSVDPAMKNSNAGSKVEQR